MHDVMYPFYPSKRGNAISFEESLEMKKEESFENENWEENDSTGNGWRSTRERQIDFRYDLLDFVLRICCLYLFNSMFLVLILYNPRLVLR